MNNTMKKGSKMWKSLSYKVMPYATVNEDDVPVNEVIDPMSGFASPK